MDDSRIDTPFLGGRVTVVVGDITQQRVDAIVNAANSTLLGGAGVDGAIHWAGGSQIAEECKKIRRTRFPEGLPTGEAVITTGGNLSAPYVIHTVGPIKGAEGGREAELLAACYWNSLALAVQHNPRQRSFPVTFDRCIQVPARRGCSRVVESH
jgi:O-acetyl-ADP-ribose deacetylase